MNNRLLLIADNIENGKGMVDVGTDHGYLPVYMLQNGYKGKVYASDINADPLNKAVRHAEESGVSDGIEFLLCDGLADCPPENIDTIVIAGMGGDMIVKILDEGYWCMSPEYKLILQPMSKAEVVRYWLVYNEFEITNELLVYENDTHYQIIVARFGGKTKLNDAELFIGKHNLADDKQLYAELFEATKDRFTRAVKEMSAGDKIPVPRLKLFEEILVQLSEMETKE